MVDARTIFYELESMGFYEYILPFMLVFVIIFAILEKTRIFGGSDEEGPKTNINTVVALIIGFLVLSDPVIVSWMNAYLSRMAFFIVLGIMMLLVVSMFGGGDSFGKGGTVLGILITLIALIWTLSSGTYGVSTPYLFYYIESYLSTILFVGLFVGFIWLVAFAGKGTPTPRRGNE
jgi:hypothetical protein